MTPKNLYIHFFGNFDIQSIYSYLRTEIQVDYFMCIPPHLSNLTSPHLSALSAFFVHISSNLFIKWVIEYWLLIIRDLNANAMYSIHSFVHALCCGGTSVVCGWGLWGAGGADVDSGCCPQLDAGKERKKVKGEGLVDLSPPTWQYKDKIMNKHWGGVCTTFISFFQSMFFFLDEWTKWVSDN